MINHQNEIVVSGMGVVSPIGTGLDAFTDSLRESKSPFTKVNFEHQESVFGFPAGLVHDFDYKASIKRLLPDDQLSRKLLRTRNLSRSASFGLCAAMEAWQDAQLEGRVNKKKVAIVSAGTNLQQQTLHDFRLRYQDKLQFLNPNYAINFFDTDVVGVLSEVLGIEGEGYSVGMASASGNAAIISGARLIKCGEYDAVIVLAPMMELSVYEYQAFTAIGAMVSLEQDQSPETIYKPFDVDHRGFVYGECAGALVLERAGLQQSESNVPYGAIASYSINLDGNRNPNPSVEGEAKVMKDAISKAGLDKAEIDYVNTHGSGSAVGDQTEVEAMLLAGLDQVKANSTKSVMGHGLTAAGLVESIALLAQMKNGFIHHSRLLKNPITNQINWVMNEAQPTTINHALNNSFAFGGANSTVLFSNLLNN